VIRVLPDSGAQRLLRWGVGIGVLVALAATIAGLLVVP
jgi:hypothetical protein